MRGNAFTRAGVRILWDCLQAAGLWLLVCVRSSFVHRHMLLAVSDGAAAAVQHC
jgi:hypothetical protein